MGIGRLFLMVLAVGMAAIAVEALVSTVWATVKQRWQARQDKKGDL